MTDTSQDTFVTNTLFEMFRHYDESYEICFKECFSSQMMTSLESSG